MERGTQSPTEQGSWGCPALATDLAVRFLQRETAGLAGALRHPSDPQVLHDALRWHDDAHRPWLALLAAVERVDAAGAARLQRLYLLHGRVAELLQRGRVRDESTRALLEAHLRQLTAEAVAGLRAEGKRRARVGRVSPTGPQQPPDAACEGSGLG